MTQVTLEDGRTVGIDELAAQADIARARGWNPSSFSTWLSRFSHPSPVGRIGGRPVYVLEDWADWKPPTAGHEDDE